MASHLNSHGVSENGFIAFHAVSLAINWSKNGNGITMNLSNYFSISVIIGELVVGEDWHSIGHRRNLHVDVDLSIVSANVSSGSRGL